MDTKPAWVKLWGGLGEASWEALQREKLENGEQELTSTEIIIDILKRRKTMSDELLLVNLRILVLVAQREQLLDDHEMYTGIIKGEK